MPLVIPDTVELEAITNLFIADFTIRLYGNDVTPTNTSVASTFTEIAGGGYLSKVLLAASWNKEAGEPSKSVYAFQQWIFTGPVDAPGSIYGYFVTRNSNGLLRWAERFPAANVPFSPINGSKIVILPKITVESQF